MHIQYLMRRKSPGLILNFLETLELSFVDTLKIMTSKEG